MRSYGTTSNEKNITVYVFKPNFLQCSNCLSSKSIFYLIGKTILMWIAYSQFQREIKWMNVNTIPVLFQIQWFYLARITFLEAVICSMFIEINSFVSLTRSVICFTTENYSSIEFKAQLSTENEFFYSIFAFYLNNICICHNFFFQFAIH